MSETVFLGQRRPIKNFGPGARCRTENGAIQSRTCWPQPPEQERDAGIEPVLSGLEAQCPSIWTNRAKKGQRSTVELASETSHRAR